MKRFFFNKIALKINNENWSKKERSEILRRAPETNLSKSRQNKKKQKNDELSSNHIVEGQSFVSKESQSD